MKVKSESEVAQSCLTLSDPRDYSLPGSSVHGIFQARVLERGAISFSKPIIRQLQIRIFDKLSTDSSKNGHHQQVSKQQMLKRAWRICNLCTLLEGMQIGSAVKYSILVPSSRKNKGIIWSGNPSSGRIPWEDYSSKRYTHPKIHCSTM